MERNRRPERWKPSPIALAAAGALAAACLIAVIALTAGGWLGQGLRRTDTLVFLAVSVAAGALAALLLVVMVRLGRTSRPAAKDNGQSGSAAIEMVLVFPIAMALVLIMVQAVLLASGTVAVQYSAYAGARAAVTWVPEKYSYEEPQNVVTDPASSDKMERIRRAAVEVLKAVSPSVQGAGNAPSTAEGQVLADGFDRFFAKADEPTPGWVHRMLPAKYDYANEHTDVTLAPPTDGETYGDHEDLSVTVRHTLFLSVPYANILFSKMPGGVEFSGDGGYGTDVEATCTLTNQGVEDEIDVEVFPRYVGRDEE